VEIHDTKTMWALKTGEVDTRILHIEKDKYTDTLFP